MIPSLYPLPHHTLSLPCLHPLRTPIHLACLYQRVTADFISFIKEGSVEIEVFAKRRVPLKAIPIPPLRVGEPPDIAYRFGKEGDDMMNALANQTAGTLQAAAPIAPQVL